MLTSVRADGLGADRHLQLRQSDTPDGPRPFVRGARRPASTGCLTLDMPPEEGEALRTAFAGAGIDTIFLLSPTTTVERIRRAATLGSGFLYGISRLGVTGVRDNVDDSARELAERVRAETALPLALGFGFSRPEHVRAVGGSGRTRGGRQRAGESHRRARTVGRVCWTKWSGTCDGCGTESRGAARRDRQIDEVIVRLLDSRARCAYAIGR